MTAGRPWRYRSPTVVETDAADLQVIGIVGDGYKGVHMPGQLVLGADRDGLGALDADFRRRVAITLDEQGQFGRDREIE